jgi:hypothetical protein
VADATAPDYGSIGDLDDFLGRIQRLIGADSGDVFESYSPLLDHVADLLEGHWPTPPADHAALKENK